jgi:hypothetical protein
MKSSQLSEFAVFFHQDFGSSAIREDSVENNIVSFFASLSYENGEEFIAQVATFEKVLFSTEGRGSSWEDLGAGKWVKELNNPQVWQAVRVLATEFPDCKSVRAKREAFEERVRELLP